LIPCLSGERETYINAFKQEGNTVYTYTIVTENGDIVMTITSEFDTRLTLDDYAAKYIVPILNTLKPIYGERLYWSE